MFMNVPATLWVCNPNFQNFISQLKDLNFETERERGIFREIGLPAVQTRVHAAETVGE